MQGELLMVSGICWLVFAGVCVGAWLRGRQVEQTAVRRIVGRLSWRR